MSMGWWHCDCDRGCGCAKSRRLNPPDADRCDRCGAKPEADRELSVSTVAPPRRGDRQDVLRYRTEIVAARKAAAR